MARYSFAKFGSRVEDPRLPLIEGDSEDANHFYWTEIWSCNFGLTAAVRTGSGEEEQPTENRPRPRMGSVTFTKKVDWGSADLFQKCCEAPEAMKVRSDEESNVPGRIDDITIEVCRETGSKLPYLILKYKKCYITSYGIEISGADPTETITMQYDEAEFEYVATDPYTGGPKQNGSSKALKMVWHEEVAAEASSGSSAGALTSGASTAAAAAGISGGGGGGGNAGGGAAPGAGAGATATEAAVAANFPGSLSQNGYGLLPD